MQRKLGIVAAIGLLCGLGLWVPGAAAQSVTGISGNVLDNQGKPMPDMVVVMKNTETGSVYNLKTDKNGHYSQIGLRPGIYEVSLKPKDKDQEILTGVKVQLGSEPDNHWDIDLRKLLQQETPEEAAARAKQEELQKKFEGMKGHFDAGRAKADAAQQVRAEIPKASADMKGPLQIRLQGLYQEALTEFQLAQQAAPEKDPNLHVVWYNLGDTYDRMGKYQEAADAYQKAIELKPDVAGYYNNLGNVLAKLGRIPEAMKAYEKSASMDPSNAASVWLNSGIVLYNAGKLAEAVEPLKRATTLAPKAPDAWYLLGASLLATMQAKQEGEKMVYTPAPGTAEAYQKYLELAPTGKYAGDAKAALDALASLGAGVDTKVRAKKKP